MEDIFQQLHQNKSVQGRSVGVITEKLLKLIIHLILQLVL